MASNPNPPALLDVLREVRHGESARDALLAPGRTAASYGDLLDQLEEISRYLRAAGIAHNDRVAVALPNGSDAAVAALGTVAAAVCAPLAPDLPEGEFAKQFTALGARAVMVLHGA